MQKKPNTGPQIAPAWIPLLLFLLIWVLVSSVYQVFMAPGRLGVSYTDFKEHIRKDNVVEVTLKGRHVRGEFAKKVNHSAESSGAKTGEQGEGFRLFETNLPAVNDPKILELLEQHDVRVNVEPEDSEWLSTFLVLLLPWLLIIGFVLYSSRKMRDRLGGGPGGLFGFGKSKAKLFKRSDTDVTLDDIAGLDNAKKELEEIIGYLKDPSRFQSLGGKLPKGILLVGPPGTGKTMMARAAAGEAGVPFYTISGSEFIEMFVGVGASRVRDMFANAKKESPSIIFIDEIDAIGRVRGTGVGGGHDEREQTLNQILAEMDGFTKYESVVVMAATNRPDVLDPALVRPGRFDRRITLERPQRHARAEILKIHTREMPLGDDVDLDVVAKRTVGFSGADLENVANEAALLAARKSKTKVEAIDFEQSIDKIILGVEREDLVNEEEKKIISYHEAGHALIAKLLPGTDPLKKVSIIPRGRSLGATEQLPEEDRLNQSRTYLLKRIGIMLGGRVAERLILDDITSGASDDLKKATQLARRMICQMGMSERLGPVTFQHGEPHPFLGRELSESKDYSEHTAEMIDEEVRRMIRDWEDKAAELLRENRRKLTALAESLMEHETLSNEDIDELLQTVEEEDGSGAGSRKKSGQDGNNANNKKEETS